MKNERIKKKDDVKLLGPLGTYLTLMKGFVCTGILYLPNAFLMGGWAFSSCAMIISAILSYYCMLLLLEVKAKINANSYTECGLRIYGKAGKNIVNLFLALS
jgi:proton-coupled amino acid transporter